jgi:hypothetical protein
MCLFCVLSWYLPLLFVKVRPNQCSNHPDLLNHYFILLEKNYLHLISTFIQIRIFF